MSCLCVHRYDTEPSGLASSNGAGSDDAGTSCVSPSVNNMRTSNAVICMIYAFLYACGRHCVLP